MPNNRLIHEKSPYLLQHAHNPVDWYPWSEEAFEKARHEDKPIFLSVGYSTCHWCHVMERESFENPAIAEVLNRYFVPVKVDREERPDVDRIYMLFVQATTGSGGWPMSVFLTPERKAFFGGTYFPPDAHYGRPGFKQVLLYLAEAWKNDRAKILASADSVLGELSRISGVGADTRHWLDDKVLDHGYLTLRRIYDSEHGGFGEAPKFPRTSVHNFLLRYARVKHVDEAAHMVLKTLEEMARGGVNDHLGGGFHRYSVDERWFVSHFEKMLYDQAQIAISYLEAHQYSGRAEFACVARSIFDYVLRDMRHPEGGFYSAEDADSVIDPAQPLEKGEGAFYIWSRQEIEEILPEPVSSWFCTRYGVAANGNVDQDPHGEFRGKNILFEACSIAETASRHGAGEAELRLGLAAAREKLLAARSQRIRPHLDDKILTAWNGLMISALALGARVLREPRYLEAAKQAADFLWTRMYHQGVLLRRFRDGDAAIDAFLDDYAFFAQALLDLYETGFDLKHLVRAREITDGMIQRFADTERGAFFSTAGGTALVMRVKDDYDGAEPSGNSVAALNLLRLAQLTGEARYRELAERTLEAFATRLEQAPVATPQMLVALMFQLAEPRQIVFAGDHASELEQAAAGLFLPNTVTLGIATDQDRAQFAQWIPALEGMRALDGKAAAYVCQNYTCQLPVTEVEDLVKLLQ